MTKTIEKKRDKISSVTVKVSLGKRIRGARKNHRPLTIMSFSGIGKIKPKSDENANNNTDELRESNE